MPDKTLIKTNSIKLELIFIIEFLKPYYVPGESRWTLSRCLLRKEMELAFRNNMNFLYSD